jgi:mono/diheme cytochrome c family protein
MIVLGISTGNKVAIAVMAAIFICFALVSAFVLPRRSPNFPGQNVGWYVFGCFVLFVAMIGTILVFGVEEKTPEAQAKPSTETKPAQTTPTATAPAQTTTKPSGGGGGGGGAGAGDAAAGKAVFTSAGCSGCHTLKAAGSSGNVGPNLDEAKPDLALIHDRVTNGKAPMPSFKDQLSPKQIDDVAAFVFSSTHS